MHESYLDIMDKIDEKPLWWDEAGVPRYCEFHPRKCNNVYINEAALVLIQCQNCGQEFRVALTHGPMEDLYSIVPNLSIARRIRTSRLHYGDPPNAGCCPAGVTMNSIPLRVLEYWNTKDHFEWERDEAFEVALDEPWGWTKANFEAKYGEEEEE